MSHPDRDLMPFSKSLIWILLSTLLVSGSALMGTLYYVNLKQKHLHDKQYNIVALIQNCLQSETLKTSYLVQLLNLSVDKPTNLYQFNLEEGEKKLLSCPLIKEGSLYKIRPGSLYVKYQIRLPIAYMGDYTNTAVDSEGVLIPFQPFFTPKKLPTLYLGTEGQWGEKVKNEKHFKLATEILSLFEGLDQGFTYVKQVDVSNAFKDSYGQKQIVVMLASLVTHKSYYLRLHTEHYHSDIEDFLSLRAHPNFEITHEGVIDFRIPQLAFIKL